MYVYNGGFLTQKRVRRILELSGYDIRLGKPDADAMIAVWGKSPTAPRGESIADKTNAPLLRVEDAFLRSIHTGRDGDAPLGLTLDKSGVHFDAASASDLETLLATHPLDDTALLNRGRYAVERLQEAHLSKYNNFDPDIPHPDPGYVIVIDQTKGDASVTSCGANSATFQEMLVFAQEENPDATVLIKTHPETRSGHREGYFSKAHETGRVQLYDENISPWRLFEGARGVYTVSSQLGFEAIYAGHKPKVFGQPFYAGWGLTDDRMPIDRRQRTLTRAQLFAAAMILYPTWYDPYRDQLCELEDVITTLEAQTRAWREDRFGWSAHGMRLWKRAHLQKIFGQSRKMVFSKHNAKNYRTMVWANQWTPDLQDATRLEDGFIRSSGLGAALVPPLSLIGDQRGIYYDPNQENDLELLIATREELPEWAERRAETVIKKIISARLSKYNLQGALHDLPDGYRILVPGQVEDDASILLGAPDVCTNLDMLKAVRHANPDAILIYKPHPDVETGLRKGTLSENQAMQYADVFAANTDPISLIEQVNEIWTMTSLIGFEALLRNVPVTCLGVPFYAGWGLTTDLITTPERRQARPSLQAFVYAALIDYPRYYDPITKGPCPIEVVLDRLANDEIPAPGALNNTLSKVQGLFASYAYLWR
nr:capsular polysaccharide biosynthesis protein [Sulfitobacter algicola]